jgi:hypothetical protein
MPGGGSTYRRGGRQKGTPNKATADIKALAQPHGASAIAALAQMAGLIAGVPAAESEATRVAAIKELLDRGFGRATQPVAGDTGMEPIHYHFTWASASESNESSEASAVVASAVDREDAGTLVTWGSSC